MISTSLAFFFFFFFNGKWKRKQFLPFGGKCIEPTEVVIYFPLADYALVSAARELMRAPAGWGSQSRRSVLEALPHAESAPGLPLARPIPLSGDISFRLKAPEATEDVGVYRITSAQLLVHGEANPVAVEVSIAAPKSTENESLRLESLLRLLECVRRVGSKFAVCSTTSPRSSPERTAYSHPEAGPFAQGNRFLALVFENHNKHSASRTLLSRALLCVRELQVSYQVLEEQFFESTVHTAIPTRPKENGVDVQAVATPEEAWGYLEGRLHAGLSLSDPDSPSHLIHGGVFKSSATQSVLVSGPQLYVLWRLPAEDDAEAMVPEEPLYPLCVDIWRIHACQYVFLTTKSAVLAQPLSLSSQIREIEELAMFTATTFFRRISANPVVQRVYAMLREQSGTDELFEEVRQESTWLADIGNAKSSRTIERIGWAIAAASFVFGVGQVLGVEKREPLGVQIAFFGVIAGFFALLYTKFQSESSRS